MKVHHIYIQPEAHPDFPAGKSDRIGGGTKYFVKKLLLASSKGLRIVTPWSAPLEKKEESLPDGLQLFEEYEKLKKSRGRTYFEITEVKWDHDMYANVIEFSDGSFLYSDGEYGEKVYQCVALLPKEEIDDTSRQLYMVMDYTVDLNKLT